MIRGAVVVLLAPFAPVAFGGSSVFEINIPDGLYREGGYPHVSSLFGAPLYDVSVAQRLYYANSTLCDDGGAAGRGGYSSPYILLVDRGDCTFVQKARTAQRLGATALVVADDRCVCGSGCEPQATCEAREPILADDGSGQDVSIAAIMLSKEDADAIKAYARCGAIGSGACAWAPWSKDAVVQASLEYSVPAPDARVEWELWTTAIDEASLDFLNDFKGTALALGAKQRFTPHFYTYNGSSYGCDREDPDADPEGDDACGNLCTNGGRYCAPDPDGSRAEGISGAHVVAENLRRTCVWKLYGGAAAPAAARGVGEPWWDYVGNFSALCGTAEAFVDAACRARAMAAAKVDGAAVEKCVADSGGSARDGGRNAILDAEVALLAEKNIVYVPECIVNGAVVWGALSPANVLSSVCHGYARDARPRACDCVEAAALGGGESYAACLAESIGDLVDHEVEHRVRSSGLPWYGAFLLVVAIVVVMLLAGLAYWKHTQAQMRDQVRGILAEYMPLEDLGGQATPGGGQTEMGKFSVSA